MAKRFYAICLSLVLQNCPFFSNYPVVENRHWFIILYFISDRQVFVLLLSYIRKHQNTQSGKNKVCKPCGQEWRNNAIVSKGGVNCKNNPVAKAYDNAYTNSDSYTTMPSAL